MIVYFKIIKKKMHKNKNLHSKTVGANCKNEKLMIHCTKWNAFQIDEYLGVYWKCLCSQYKVKPKGSTFHKDGAYASKLL